MLPEILQSRLLSNRVKLEFWGSTLAVLTDPPRNTYAKADIGLLLRAESWILPLRRKNELPSWSVPQHVPPPPTLTDLQEQGHSVKCLSLTKDVES